MAIKLKIKKNQRSVVKKLTNRTASTASGQTNERTSTTSRTTNTTCVLANRQRNIVSGQMCIKSEQTNIAIGRNVLRMAGKVIW